MPNATHSCMQIPHAICKNRHIASGMAPCTALASREISTACVGRGRGVPVWGQVRRDAVRRPPWPSGGRSRSAGRPARLEVAARLDRRQRAVGERRPLQGSASAQASWRRTSRRPAAALSTGAVARRGRGRRSVARSVGGRRTARPSDSAVGPARPLAPSPSVARLGPHDHVVQLGVGFDEPLRGTGARSAAAIATS